MKVSKELSCKARVARLKLNCFKPSSRRSKRGLPERHLKPVPALPGD